MHVSLRRCRSAARPASYSAVRALAGQAAASWWEVPGVGGRQVKPERELQGMTGGYLVHDALVRNGVRVVFGYSGGAVLPVLDCTLPLARFQEGLDKIKQGRSIGKVVCLPCGDDSDSDESFRWGAASSPL